MTAGKAIKLALGRWRRTAARAASHVGYRRLADAVIRRGADILDRTGPKRFARLGTIDLSYIGLGDNLMCWAGLHALLHAGHEPVRRGCVLYVPVALAGLAAAIFAPFGLDVVGIAPGDAKRLAGPILSPRTPEDGAALSRTLFGPDWYINCFQAIDAQKMPRPDGTWNSWERFSLGLSERLVQRRAGWQAVPAEYVGYRLWLPIARRLGLYPLRYLTLMKQALVPLRVAVHRYLDSLPTAPPPICSLAVFPSGKSFQAIPAEQCVCLSEALHQDDPVFYIPPDDPWIAAYRASGLQIRHLGAIEDIFSVLRTARVVITTDSFSSHAAQFLRDDFVLALTRDLRENVVHPGANPAIITSHPPCAPCHYIPRTDLRNCQAGYQSCRGFDQDLIARVADAARRQRRYVDDIISSRGLS